MRERKQQRYPVEIWGRFRRKGLSYDSYDVPILDLSEVGCRLFDRHGHLSIDERIRLSIENIGPFDATVRWRCQGYVGVEFANPLYGPVFEHIRDKVNNRAV